MRVDADDAACKFAATGRVAPAARLMQGIARILSGDLDGGDAVLEEAVRVCAENGPPDVLAQILCERSLVAMARGQWARTAGRLRLVFTPIGAMNPARA
jgi:hypothetical protein